MDNLGFFSIIVIALGLSADCFAVAFGSSISLPQIPLNRILRTATSFGLFQAVMPTIGWFLGHNLVQFIESFDHWVAFALLVFVGIRMIWESLHKKEGDEKQVNITRGVPLLVASFATSIDSLAAGLSFAFLNVSIVMAVATIGVTAFIITGVGFFIGRKAGRYLGKWAETVGGIILISIGIKIILSHLFGW